jgi:hypothetical protein
VINRSALIAAINNHFAFDDQSPADCETWRQLSPERESISTLKKALAKTWGVRGDGFT